MSENARACWGRPTEPRPHRAADCWRAAAHPQETKPPPRPLLSAHTHAAAASAARSASVRGARGRRWRRGRVADLLRAHKRGLIFRGRAAAGAGGSRRAARIVPLRCRRQPAGPPVGGTQSAGRRKADGKETEKRGRSSAGSVHARRGRGSGESAEVWRWKREQRQAAQDMKAKEAPRAAVRPSDIERAAPCGGPAGNLIATVGRRARQV